MIFFDLDDTLLDDRAAARSAARFLLELKPPGLGEFEAMYARWEALGDLMFKRFVEGDPALHEHRARGRARVQGLWPDLTDAQADERYAAYRDRFFSVLKPFDDVLPCLAALNGKRFGLITNGDTAQQTEKLERTGLRDRFSVVVVSSEVGAAKPDPRIFAEACRRAGEAAGACWHTGDKLDKDAQAASAAGLHGVWLCRSAVTPADLKMTTIRSLGELPALFG